MSQMRGIIAGAFGGVVQVQLESIHLMQSVRVVNICDCFFCEFALNISHCSKQACFPLLVRGKSSAFKLTKVSTCINNGCQ